MVKTTTKADEKETPNLTNLNYSNFSNSLFPPTILRLSSLLCLELEVCQDRKRLMYASHLL